MISIWINDCPHLECSLQNGQHISVFIFFLSAKVTDNSNYRINEANKIIDNSFIFHGKKYADSNRRKKKRPINNDNPINYL